jgi:hypothetical protein
LLLLRALVKGLKETRRELKGLGQYFEPKRFEEEDLENGLHTMRRALRWITMMVQSADGLVSYLPPQPRTFDDRRLISEYGQSKYAQLSENGAVSVDQLSVLKISKLVTELGSLKDFKESQLDLAHVLMEKPFRLSRGNAEARAFDVMTRNFGPTHVEAQARSLYEWYLKNDPLKDLQKSLERSIEEFETGSRAQGF